MSAHLCPSCEMESPKHEEHQHAEDAYVCGACRIWWLAKNRDELANVYKLRAAMKDTE